MSYFLLFNRFHICLSVILGFFGNRLSGDTSLQSVLGVQGQSIEIISAKHFPPYDVVATISRPVPAAYHAFIWPVLRARFRPVPVLCSIEWETHKPIFTLFPWFVALLCHQKPTRNIDIIATPKINADIK